MKVGCQRGSGLNHEVLLMLTCEWRAMPLPLNWLNCFWPIAFFTNTTMGANRPLPACALPMVTTAFTGLAPGLTRTVDRRAEAPVPRYSLVAGTAVEGALRRAIGN